MLQLTCFHVIYLGTRVLRVNCRAMKEEWYRVRRGCSSKMSTTRRMSSQHYSWQLVLLVAMLTHITIINVIHCFQPPPFARTTTSATQSRTKDLQATPVHDDFNGDEAFALNLSEASSLQLPDYVIDDDDQMILYPASQSNFEPNAADGPAANSLKVRRQIGADEWAGLGERGDFLAERQETYPLLSGAFLHSHKYTQQQYGGSNSALDSQQDDVLFNAINGQQLRAQTAAGPQADDSSTPLVGANQKVGPTFTREPPSFIHYLNSSDLVIPCAASGQPPPSITWWHKQGSQVKPGSLLDKRYVRYDNALVISAFGAHEFEPELHSTSYRCQAQNALGTIMSRDVVINAVLDQEYEASVADQFVAVDNDALFRCQVAPQLRDLFQVIGWLEDGQQLIGGTGSQAQSQAQILASLFTVGSHTSGANSFGAAASNSWMPSLTSTTTTTTTTTRRRSQAARASMLPNGQLMLAHVQLRDANKSYRCQMRNLLSGRITLSAISGRLFVTDANESGAAARIVEGPKTRTVGKLQEQLLLTCLAQGSPRPTIRWFKWTAGESAATSSSSKEPGQWIELQQPAAAVNYSQNQVIKSQNESQQQQQARFLLSSENNFLLIKSLQLADRRARFKCLANNSFGAHQLETEIQFERWPTSKLLELKPRVEFISSGGVAGRMDQTTTSLASTRQLSSKQLVLNCTIRASPTQPIRAIEWLKNGRQLFAISLASPSADSPSSSFNRSLALGKTANELPTQSSLFDDPNQELTVIEQLWPQTSDSLSGGQDQLEGGQDHELSRSNLLDVFGQGGSSRVEQQQQQELFEQTPLVSSSTLAKLTEAVERREDSAGGRRFSHKLRVIDDEQLLYQLIIWQPQRRAERGSYQCRAATGETTLQQTSQLLLRDTAPKFVETFAGQLIGGGGGGGQTHERAAATAASSGVSLKCVASGSPLPEISWTLSGFPVPESSRFRVGDYVTRDGLIVSFVNISQVQVEDGGLYECTASNDVGQLRHAAWLNVTGPPHVRPMSNMSAIAGGSLVIMCPVGGWPIEQISWFKNGTKLPANHRQKVFPNGTLQVAELNELLDAGQYSCQAKWARPAPASELFASSQVHVTIKIPPVVEPFSFAKSLHRGQRYNIMCTVTRGDLPVSIRWFKDGQPIGTGVGSVLSTSSPMGANQFLSGERVGQLQQQTLELGESQQSQQLTQQLRAEHQFGGLAIKQLDPYSSTLTFGSLQSHHRGLYACEAQNEVGRANQSSTLAIHVPPEWRIEPNDLSVTIGRTAVIDCQADGFPAARVEWRLSQDLFREPPTEFKPIVSSLYMRVFENGSLIIYNTQRSDAGYYLCQASNGVGPGISRVIKLTVHVAAHFKSKIRTELVRRGQAARLRCEALGDPPLEINWLKDKAPLYYAQLDEPRYSLTRTPLQDGLRSELVIQEAERQDSALFTCLAQNQFGSDDTNIQLLVQAPPDLLQDVRVQDYEARSVKLSWQPGYAGNSPISKFVLMFAPIQQQQQQNSIEIQHNSSPARLISGFTNISLAANETAYLLQGLTPLTEYQFYLVAVNALGSSPLQQEPIRFRTDDEAPSSPPLKVRAQAISAHSIRVRWRAPERRQQQQHYGAISGFYVGYKLIRPNSPIGGALSSQPSSELNTATLSRQQALQSSSTTTASSSVAKPLDTYVYKTVEFNHNAQLINELMPSSLNRSSQQQVGYLEQECQINSLRRGQKYLITVHPFNARGSGPASEPVVAETWRIDVPDAPSLRMVARTTHSIHLAWRLPSTTSTKSSQLISNQSNKKLRMLEEAEDESNTTGNDEDNKIARRKQRSGQQPYAARYLAQTQTSNEHQANDDAAQLAAEELAAEEAQANEPILGFILSRKQLSGASGSSVAADSKQVLDSVASNSQAVEMRLPSDHTAQIIDGLNCGTRYQFTVAAINSVGVSAPSEPLIVKTEGSTPVAPDRNSLLSLNSSSVVINLAAWHNGACAMRSFDILFKQSRSKKWSSVTNYQVAPHQSGAERSSKGVRDNQSRSLVTSEASGEQSQRSAGGSGSGNHAIEWQQLQENGTVVLDDLATSINYDLKILATNEAGTTEAIYTFNTNGQTISSLDQQWSTGGEFQFSEGQLSELFASAGTLASLLPLLLLLLLVGLSLTTGCILFSRRKHHSSSNCSLSISSRSNQSSSNYCTTTTTGAGSSAVGALSSEPGGLMKNSSSTFLQSANHKYNQLEQSEQQKLMEEDGGGGGGARTLTSFAGKHQTIRLGDIYGHSGAADQLANGNNYAYLTSTMRQRHPTGSPQNTDVTSVLNGSEAEMCLGASALNLSSQANNGNRAHHHHSLTLNNKRTSFNHQQSADYYLAAAAMNNQQQAANNALLMTEQHTANSKLASQLAQLGKSSTLPSNCHQQMLQKLLFQQQNQQQQQQLDSEQQALLDSFVAANMMQQQQHQSECGPDNENQHAIAYASLQAAMQQQQQQFNNPLNEQEAQTNLANLLDQQVRQQLYATVKRGCPRGPNQQVYTTIYQCPATSEQQQVVGGISEPQQQQQMACCSGQLQGPNACADSQGQMFCFHQPISQQTTELQAQECNQQQQQQHTISDYQQLRPLN